MWIVKEIIWPVMVGLGASTALGGFVFLNIFFWKLTISLLKGEHPFDV